jgi:MscS family membrane protein
LAVALAAQGTLKGLFGTMSILLDKPYRVGERILVHGYDGFVEDIGLRSTKIRTLSGHQVSIPNNDMSESQIENIGRRPHIRRATRLHLPIDSSREKIENALKVVREALTDHEGMDPEFPPALHSTSSSRTHSTSRSSTGISPPTTGPRWRFRKS